MEPIQPIRRRRQPSPVEIVLRQQRASLRERDEHEPADERPRRPPARPQPPAPPRPVADDGGEAHIDVLA